MWDDARRTRRRKNAKTHSSQNLDEDEGAHQPKERHPEDLRGTGVRRETAVDVGDDGSLQVIEFQSQNEKG